jgi:hypothetical protein
MQDGFTSRKPVIEAVSGCVGVNKSEMASRNASALHKDEVMHVQHQWLHA